MSGGGGGVHVVGCGLVREIRDVVIFFVVVGHRGRVQDSREGAHTIYGWRGIGSVRGL